MGILKKMTKKYVGLLVTVCFIAFGVLVFGIISEASGNTCEERLLAEAKATADYLGFTNKQYNPFIVDPNRTMEVKEIDNYNYKITINDDVYSCKFPKIELMSDEIERQEVKDPSEKILKFSQKAKEKIFSYIDESTVLVDADKEGIKDYIDSIPIKVASYDLAETDGIVADYSNKDRIIYINSKNIDFVSVSFMVHEYVHAVAHYTNQFDSSARYKYTVFNEVLTQAIMISIYPKYWDDIDGKVIVKYDNYLPIIYPYIDIAKLDAVKGYFYGYTDDMDIPMEELDFFVEMLNSLSSVDTSIANNLAFKWYANKSNS